MRRKIYIMTFLISIQHSLHMNKHLLKSQSSIFLTNIQRFVIRNDEENKNSPIDYFLGDKPVSKTTDNKIRVREIVNNVKDIIVFNDEAHHIHEKKLAWFKTIENINNSLIQKGTKLALQLDVTATPKDQKGNIFPHTISALAAKNQFIN